MLLKESIQTLLVGDVADTSTSSPDQISISYKQERLLVSWVLLTRIPEDDLVDLWTTHGANLETFAISMLNDNRDPCHLLYIRLFAQAYSRIVERCPLDLGRRLFECWGRHERKQDLKLSIDVLSCLDVLVADHPSVSKELNVVEKLWDFYTSGSMETESKEKDVPKEESYPSQEWDMMAKTLNGTLQGTDASYYSVSTLNETILTVFQRSGFEHVPQSMIPKILSWVSKSKQSITLPPDLRSLWVEWTLGLFQTLASNKKVDTILRHTGVPDDLNRLLLAIIVSPTSDKESRYGSLRAMAWQTLVSILETCGWAWAFRITATGKLGNGTPLCTWTRLASGEWRLQLQKSESGDVSTPEEGAGDAIGDATARLLIATTEFCIELSEKITVSLSSDAVLHLYQSLEESLMSTLEYITLERESRIVGLFSTTATRLFGTLLREFDIWTLQKKDVETSQATIDGLAYLLESSDENCLLPAIANILEASDSDSTRKKDMLKLWDPFLSYMQRFWETTASKWSQQDSRELGQIVPWACTCLDWWIDGAFPESKNTVQNRRRIQVAVLKFIGCAMSSNLDSQSRTSLSLALGCYMTLSQEQSAIPSENESMLIFRALQTCEIQNSEMR
ncbi:unnamed protein product [Cylindrotheca closterium]|uniref:Uncharacterized protein n=1 Tax=Cylindrotheca closterium TaxID=2856 RepID=A0AAD2FTZ3_9STRA|nr:unnamed protein product [Cylindrotheca closterium]